MRIGGSNAGDVRQRRATCVGGHIRHCIRRPVRWHICFRHLGLGDRHAEPTKAQPIVQCAPDPKTWFARFLADPGIKEAVLSSAIAIDASCLPGAFHADPMDRLIVATARHLRLPIVTRDRRITFYAKAGHVSVTPC
jgi:PIN domain nuclease of toxin-antitoxin system